MCCSHLGKVALAAMGTAKAPRRRHAPVRCRVSAYRKSLPALRAVLRDDIEGDLLAAQIVGDVLRGDGERVTTDGKIAGDGEDARVGSLAGVPTQDGGSNALDLRGQR